MPDALRSLTGRRRLTPARDWCAWLRAVCGVTLLLMPASLSLAQDAPSQASARAVARAAAARVPTLEAGHRRLAEARRRHALAPTAQNERRLADAYRDTGVLDAALEHYSAAFTLDPTDAAAFEGAARIWRDWGYPALALPHAYRAAFWAPQSASAQSTLGTVLLRLGRLDAAAARFGDARRLQPTAAYPVNNLCYLELRRARPADAVALCSQAAALDPGSRVIRNNLAVAFALAGNLDAAFGVFEPEGSSATGAYNQGLLWLAAQRPDLARDAFSRARVADPGFRAALNRLRQLSAPGKEH